MVRLGDLGAPQADPALGRPAPARRAGARARQPPARAAARRAARRARPQAAPGDADRAQAHPARASGITFVYVTHDQEEALTMSDRIAVFSSGRIEQVGTPAEIYEQPANEFVAGLRRHLEHPRARRRRASPPPGEDPHAGRRRAGAGGMTASRRGRARSSTSACVTRYIVELDGGGAAGRAAPEHGRPRRRGAEERRPAGRAWRWTAGPHQTCSRTRGGGSR